MKEQLVRERQRVELAWTRYFADGQQAPVKHDVLASWERSRGTIPLGRVSAPVDDPDAVHAEWLESPLEWASRPLRDELQSVADEGELIVAISDASGRLLWTKGSARMQRLAHGINFIPGGRWDENSVGTNALGLALRTGQPVRVFAAEHYVQAVHDWVCYSAPIRHPRSGRIMGLLDFSTTWEYTSPLGLVSARHYAHAIEQALCSQAAPDPGLRLRLCGAPQVLHRGRPLHLSPRQHELLAVLVLHPEGLSLDALHALVYGDQPVSRSTLKSEISTLRSQLDGGITSRPYRLMTPTEFDVLAVEDAMLAGRVREAVDLYGGPLLPYSSSPFLSYYRTYLDGALRAAVLRCSDPDTMWSWSVRFREDPEVLGALLAQLSERDPRRPAVSAMFAALADA